jgi:S1-C subfamily serine protease
MRFLFLFLATLSLAPGAPRIIEDSKLHKAFEVGVGKFAADESLPSAVDLAAAAKNLPESWMLEKPEQLGLKSPGDIEDSVFLIGSVYKCDNCERWHPGGVATAWALSRDGLMVTNHHVFEKAKGGAMGICDRKGKTFPVVELLAANEEADVVLFRVKGDDFQPLALGKPAKVGSRVHVLSHPNRRYFMHTFGDVSRYHRKPGRDGRPDSVWMSITADYAKGSSGGPVMNRKGQVVGMVSSTQSIYYQSNNGQPKGPLQMVVKNCVPVSAIRALLEKGKN